MTEIRRADPAARRQALLLLVLGAFVGTALILGFERSRQPLIDWLMSEPEKFAQRMNIVMLLTAALLSAPLIGFAVYLWSLGARVLRAEEFPSPGYRVIRDTPVMGGQAAVLRGHGFKALALCLAVASALLCVLFWRLALVFNAQ